VPVMVERKDRIRRIILSNGTVMKFAESEFEDATNYENQRKMAIKLDLFSVLSGTTSIAFEQSIKPGSSWEVGIGMIGLGSNPSSLPVRSGAFFRGGFKFINTPDYYLKGMRYTHILKGAYIRPELAIHVFDQSSSTIEGKYNSSTFTYNYYQTESKDRFSGSALMLNFGKQWVFSDIFLVDVFVGGGIGLGNKSNLSSTTTLINQNSYWDYYSESPDSPMGTGFGVSHEGGISFAGQMGLKLGILLGAKKNEK